MTWHPLILAVLAGDLTAALLLAAASATAFRTVLHWRPNSSEGRQLDLEIANEAASVLARFSTAFFVFGTVLLLIGICLIFPGIVPGAMCGTGVVQASQGYGSTAVMARLMAAGLMGLWLVLDKFNRNQPEGFLTVATARALLIAVPLICIAVWLTWQFSAYLDTQKPVDCCAVVYNAFQSRDPAAETAGIPDPYWLVAFLAASLVLMQLAIRTAIDSRHVMRKLFRCYFTATALVWGPAAYIATIRILSAYHFEVLHHHCPWCLFLPEHRMIGFVLLAAFWWVFFEILVVAVLPSIVHHHPGLQNVGFSRIKSAGWRILVSLSVLLLLTIGPALYWRLRYGVWMSG